MYITLAIDPGLRGIGWALAESSLPSPRHQYKRFIRAGYYPGLPVGKGRGPVAWRAFKGLRAEVERGLTSPVTGMILEWPEWYYERRGRVVADDLFQLCAVDGFVQGLWPDVPAIGPLPKEWKGQITKAVMHNRLFRKLSKEDMERIELPRDTELAHNVYDAVSMLVLKTYGGMAS